MSTKPLQLTGLVAATFTPMQKDGSLHLDAIPPVVEHLIRWKVAGLYVVGSTGEGVSLTSAERKMAVETFVRAAGDRIPIIVQVGHNSVAEACDMAAHAEQIGAAAVSATPPSYFKPATAERLVRTMAEIASAAPTRPFYYYHIPHVTGVRIGMLDFLDGASSAIPTLAGIKFTSPAFDEMLACLQFRSGAFEILSGFDEMLLSALAIGVKGAVGSTYNFAAPVYGRILDAVARCALDEARLWQSRAVAMIRCVVKHDGLAGQKAVMKMLGYDCGPTRLPLAQLDDKQFDAMRKELQSLGFFQWIGMENKA